MSIKKHAVHQTGRLHLKDANDMPLYAEGADGKPDLKRPMVAVIYSPATPQYLLAKQMQANDNLELLKSKGKVNRTPDEARKASAAYLTAITHSLENVEYDGLAGEDLHLAVYQDASIGFIADQVAAYQGHWENFTKDSATS